MIRKAMDVKQGGLSGPREGKGRIQRVRMSDDLG